MDTQHYRALPHRTAFSGQNLLQHYYPRVPISQIQDQLASVDSYTRMREPKRPKPFNPIYCRRRRQLFQADLLDKHILATRNRGVNYHLIVVDTFSRFAFSRPLRRKTAAATAAAFESILEEAGGQPVERLMTDGGTEFTGAEFQQMLTARGIRFNVSNNHASHVERLIRSIQSILGKYTTEMGSMRYEHIMQEVMSSYNSRRHRIIRCSPKDADKEENGDYVRLAQSLHYKSVEDRAEKKKAHRFRSGDLVRHLKKRTKFFRSFHETFTTTIYRIKTVLTHLPVDLFVLEDLTGVEAPGRWYAAELQATKLAPFKVLKVFRRKSKVDQATGELQYLVRWEGLPASYDSYVSENSLPAAARTPGTTE
jgi:transposase InsO family protein